MVYDFQHFTLYQEPDGTVITKFPCGHSSITPTNEHHAYHGQKLGISANDANLLHELAHHVVAIANGLKYCPIVYATAHHQEMPQGADVMEWIITALTYYVRNKPQHDNNAEYALRRIPNLEQTAKDLLTLFTTWETIWAK